MPVTVARSKWFRVFPKFFRDWGGKLFFHWLWWWGRIR